MTIKIIGAGFGRTGTASLKIALEKLLGAPCYHMSEVLGHAGHIQLWDEVGEGRPDWDTIFKGYAATVDFPGSTYWRALSEHYPDAKIILSLRDAERWFESTQATIFSPTMFGMVEHSPWGAMIRKTIHHLFNGKPNDHDTLIRVFNAHNEAVKAAFGPDRLLVFEAKQGWAPLCKFLNVPIPDEPFPRVNSSAEFDGLFEMLKSPVGQQMIAGGGAGGDNVHDQVFDRK